MIIRDASQMRASARRIYDASRIDRISISADISAIDKSSINVTYDIGKLTLQRGCCPGCFTK